MIRMLIIACTILMFCAGASGGQEKPEKILFAGIEWETDLGGVKEAMVTKGYIFSDTTKYGDLLFTGEVAEEDALIKATIDSSRSVCQFVIILLTEEHEARQKFRELKNLLSKSYGEPDENFNLFLPPYREGDGYEEQAIRNNKAHIASMWLVRGQEGGGFVLQISNELQIRIQYDGPKFAAELDRRKRASSSDLIPPSYFQPL